MARPKIALTMGDPAGVGPELVLRAAADEGVLAAADPVIYGAREALEMVARRLGLEMPKRGVLREVTSMDTAGLTPGLPDPEAGRAMIECIEGAVLDALAERVDAVVTAPINKETARLAGFDFPGHTEFIAHLCGGGMPVMMLCGPGRHDLKVALVTTHVAIKDLPAQITEKKVLAAIRITARSLEELFGIPAPRIAVAGLNPHAGEGGIFGTEDETQIAPAVEKARAGGLDVLGPLPADTLFYRAVKKKDFDAIVCMYHDQGLGPLKLLHFEDGINTTLGLPVIRTSPDHGTAYDIAWQGKASPESIIAAIKMAAMMAKNREKYL